LWTVLGEVGMEDFLLDGEDWYGGVFGLELLLLLLIDDEDLSTFEYLSDECLLLMI